MGRLLDRLVKGSPAYSVRREAEGFVLVGRPDRLDEFSDLVRRVTDDGAEEFAVFPTTDSDHRYCEAFILPLDGAPAASDRRPPSAS